MQIVGSVYLKMECYSLYVPNYNAYYSQVNAGYLDMLKAFEVYDKGGRGLLSREDFKRVLKHFTVDLTKSQIETLLQRYL